MMTAFDVAGVKMYQSLERILSILSKSRYIAALPQREWMDFQKGPTHANAKKNKKQ